MGYWCGRIGMSWSSPSRRRARACGWLCSLSRPLAKVGKRGSTCSMNAQHATRNTNAQHATLRHAACSMRRASASLHHRRRPTWQSSALPSVLPSAVYSEHSETYLPWDGTTAILCRGCGRAVVGTAGDGAAECGARRCSARRDARLKMPCISFKRATA